MVFCKNCGKELPSVDSVICPACGVAQRDITSTTVSIQSKNSGTATIIALVAGFFGFNGLGHIYISKTAFGDGEVMFRASTDGAASFAIRLI